MLESVASQNVDFDKITKMLDEGKTPVVKFGIDPTSPHLHIGHLVPLFMLQELMLMGCHAVIVLGDLTAQIGDPSGLDKFRPTMSHAETKENADKLVGQISMFLHERDSHEFIFNSSIKPSLEELFSLTQKVSINSMLGRDHFSARHKKGDSISLLEMTCPVLQAWDSIQIRCDLEIGGNDQLSNCVLARDLMEKSGVPKQSILLFPILTGTDGHNKMSKSLNNHISLTHSPEDVFGRTMSIPDNLIAEWSKLLFLETVVLDNPVKQKEKLAHRITALIHGVQKANEASEWFDKTFRKKQVEATDTFSIVSGASIVEAIVEAGLAKSKSEAKRLISGNGVRINGDLAQETDLIKSSCILQKGKRTAVNITIA